jgi:hypothetical protein
VAIGVDSHKSTLTAAVVDELGRHPDSRQFISDSSGHEALHNWITLRAHSSRRRRVLRDLRRRSHEVPDGGREETSGKSHPT